MQATGLRNFVACNSCLVYSAHLQQHLNGGIVPSLLWEPPLAEQRLDQTAPPTKRLRAL